MILVTWLCNHCILVTFSLAVHAHNVIESYDGFASIGIDLWGVGQVEGGVGCGVWVGRWGGCGVGNGYFCYYESVSMT